MEVGLYKKMQAVMKDVAYLSKDDSVEFKSTKYKAISEEKVTSAVRTAMVEHGLVIFPIEQHIGKDGNLSSVNTKYKIVDVDTGQFEIIASSGEGADTQDKGVGKAMTYAYKYLLLRTFAIPTGEDPDKISSAELDAKQEEASRKEVEEDAKLKKQLEAKWQTLAGNMDGFEKWHGDMLAKGGNNRQLNELLAKKLLDKQKESA